MGRLNRPCTATWNVRRPPASGPPGRAAAGEAGTPRTDSSRRPERRAVSSATSRVLRGMCAAVSGLPSISCGRKGGGEGGAKEGFAVQEAGRVGG
jgi:hypothetical protein